MRRRSRIESVEGLFDEPRRREHDDIPAKARNLGSRTRGHPPAQAGPVEPEGQPDADPIPQEPVTEGEVVQPVHGEVRHRAKLPRKVDHGDIGGAAGRRRDGASEVPRRGDGAVARGRGRDHNLHGYTNPAPYTSRRDRSPPNVSSDATARIASIGWPALRRFTDRSRALAPA